MLYNMKKIETRIKEGFTVDGGFEQVLSAINTMNNRFKDVESFLSYSMDVAEGVLQSEALNSFKIHTGFSTRESYILKEKAESLLSFFSKETIDMDILTAPLDTTLDFLKSNVLLTAFCLVYYTEGCNPKDSVAVKK